ncbi:DUF397 domain-containing protein [Natronoglycomyces albus]|uniref:DUF397 domain-containing protein n=1 Tax=Natronoglycomyces albus TaxID=2811108 RepID=A0A895XHL4_9ACTN|nr:DUF397 domain-containing protein [Natronoglycomyces albus]QSB04834.1 DUF397 domain-containing protein [Natronoglycomyces albus]
MTTQGSIASRSGNQGQCVEARINDGVFQVRDSKLADGSPLLTMTGSDLRALIRTSAA